MKKKLELIAIDLGERKARVFYNFKEGVIEIDSVIIDDKDKLSYLQDYQLHEINLSIMRHRKETK